MNSSGAGRSSHHWTQVGDGKGWVRLAGQRDEGRQERGPWGSWGRPASAWLTEDSPCRGPGGSGGEAWLLTLGYPWPSVLMPGTAERGQSSGAGGSVTPGVLTQWMEWEMTPGQMQGREGSQHEVQAVQRPGPKSLHK